MLKFKLTLAETPVELEGSDGGIQKYTLREMTSKIRQQYLNGIMAKVKFDSKGAPTDLSKAASLDTELLSLTLFGPEDEPVTLAELEKFPASVIQALSEEAQKINALDKTGVEEAKND